MEVAELEYEAPAIRSLSFLFKLTKVYLWDDASTETRQVSPSMDGSITFQDDKDSSNSASTTTDFCPSPVDWELAEQMNAMGFPLSFRSNKEKRNGIHGGKIKTTKKKNLHNRQAIEDGPLDSDKVSEEMIISHTTSYDNTSNYFSFKSMLQKSESSYCHIEEDNREIQHLSGEVEDSVALTACTGTNVEISSIGAGASGIVDCGFAVETVSSKIDIKTETSFIKMDDVSSTEHSLTTNGVEHVEEELDD